MNKSFIIFLLITSFTFLTHGNDKLNYLMVDEFNPEVFLTSISEDEILKLSNEILRRGEERELRRILVVFSHSKKLTKAFSDDIIRLIKDDRPSVRYRAIIASGSLSDEGIIRILNAQLANEDVSANRIQISIAIEKIEQSALSETNNKTNGDTSDKNSIDEPKKSSDAKENESLASTVKQTSEESTSLVWPGCAILLLIIIIVKYIIAKIRIHNNDIKL